MPPRPKQPPEYLYGHMLQEYYVQRVRGASAERQAARAKVRTKAALRKLQEEVRRKLRKCFGPLPARTPLDARVEGAVRRKDCRIEKVIYHSRPGFPVTANLYVPHGDGPFPAVLGACGHSLEGKAAPFYQAFCQNLARQGYLVLIYDPIGQGERLQFFGMRGKDVPRSCTHEHNMLGKQMALLGDFFGLWRTWDGIRGLDYLLSRPEADPARVGVTGNSGGGTLTTWLTGLDERFTMAAPGCFVTTTLANTENEHPQDSEQMVPRLLAKGLDLADFFVAHLPRPTILLGQKKDAFDPRGLTSLYQELRRLYAVAGAEEDIALVIGPTFHGYSVHNREAMYRFFNKHAGVQADGKEPGEPKPETVETLQATETGQVVGMKPKRVFDFTAENAAKVAAKHKAPKDLPAAVARALALPRRSGPPHFRVMRMRSLGKYQHRHSSFAVESEPGIQAVLHLFDEAEPYYYFPQAADLPGAPTLYVPHLSTQQDVLAGLAPEAAPLFAVDVRGMGQTTALTCNNFEFFAPYGSDYFYNSLGLMLAEPYCGRRVHDLLSVLDLFGAHGFESVRLAGRGMGAVTAALAAVVHPLAGPVTLVNPLLSWHELTQKPISAWPDSARPYGVLKKFDLPDCFRWLAKAKGLELVSPWDAKMRVMGEKALEEALEGLGLAGLAVGREGGRGAR